ncbi:MAG: hypothetical protein CL840_13270 [Crocinitomicaceae bacterium]|nr:hypothetical protein [Crocinitomicaceae bacterium]
MKRFILNTLLVVSTLNLFSQQAAEGHENHFKNPDAVETDQYKIEFEDVMAENNFAKLKVKITNKTKQYLLVDLSKVVFRFDHGEYSPKGKTLIIEPIKSKSKVLEVKGEGGFHVEKFSIAFEYIATLPLTGEPIPINNFRLPPNSKEFMTGPVSCAMGKLKKESRITSTTFSCKYLGDKYMVVNPLSITAVIESGKSFPNVAKTGGGLSSMMGPGVMQKGDKKKVPVEFRISTKIIDMQFATFYVVWNETFSESEPTVIEGASADFEIDPGKTAAQNK